ncbi:MAG TPA: TIGR03621 family F420-dependent LLM class oxidoreductase [Thermomicrobiaceae bacterium]|nr:TIGR03621 family F420-dependent LLM class oxidoreductase [Thermomicrobiaceae bacterium]
MSERRPFRFGVLAESARTRHELLETARQAEALGYDTLLLRDHFIEEPFGHQLAPIAALTAVACATSTLRVGSLVLANDYRHPALLAKEAATLDLLSEGRFELGLGAGFSQAEYAAAGLRFERGGLRIERLAETVAVLKGLFSDEPYSFSGRHYQIEGLRGFPVPRQRPHPPLLLAGGGRRILSLAAREANIVGLLSVSTASGAVVQDPTERLAATMERKIGWIRQAAGERFAALELSSTIHPVVTNWPRAAADDLARGIGWQGWGVTTGDVLAMPSLAIGSSEGITEQLCERRERFGLTYYVVSDRHLTELAPVVARLSGANQRVPA